MNKVIIFGISAIVKNLDSGFWNEYINFRKDIKIIAFTDLDSQQWGKTYNSLPIIAPKEINLLKFDEIIIASITSCKTFENYCINNLLIPIEKINSEYVKSFGINRNKFLKSFAKIVYDKNIKGSVAEGGVFEGGFARKINEYFPDRKIYLFDTFEGFDLRDINYDNKKGYTKESEGHFSSNLAKEEKIREILPYPENAIIKKGFFPETAKGINDEFVFVNLDFDLYKPTIEGLNFFWDKMKKGGIILIHDFFNDYYKGAKIAVDEFCNIKDINYIPIGDEFSVAIIK